MSLSINFRGISSFRYRSIPVFHGSIDRRHVPLFSIKQPPSINKKGNAKLGYDEEKIRRLVRAIYGEFDVKSVSEVEDVCRESDYQESYLKEEEGSTSFYIE